MTSVENSMADAKLIPYAIAVKRLVNLAVHWNATLGNESQAIQYLAYPLAANIEAFVNNYFR